MLQSYDEELIKEIQDATGVERQLVIIALTYNKGDANKVIIEFLDDFGKSFEKYSGFIEIKEEQKENELV